MIVAGIKLTLLGMTVVYLFLLLLIACIKISCWLLSAAASRELAEMEAAESKSRRRHGKPLEDGRLIAIISAAIAAHRSRMRSIQ